MSIGSSNPIGGSNVAFSIFARSIKSPGGAIQGWMPQTTQNVDKTYPEFEQIRWTLKEAWNTKYRGQFEERMKAVMNELEKNDDIILFIDSSNVFLLDLGLLGRAGLNF
jgi:hypothetical protein